MAKLYYGGGNCSMDIEARGLEIRYKGAIEIEDLTPDGIYIIANNNGILIFSINGSSISKDLFNYTGEFKILSIKAVDGNGEKIPTTIHRVMDYTELLTGNTESMTINTEDLKVTHTTGKRISKTIVDKQHIENLVADNLYLEDGTLYEGKYFHIHLTDNAAMTEREHTENSQPLFVKVNNKIVPTTKRYIRNKRKPTQRIRRRR